MTSVTRVPAGVLALTLLAASVIGLVFFTVIYLVVSSGGGLGEAAGIIPKGWIAAHGAVLTWTSVVLTVPATAVAGLRVLRSFAALEDKPAA